MGKYKVFFKHNASYVLEYNTRCIFTFFLFLFPLFICLLVYDGIKSFTHKTKLPGSGL